MPRFAANLSFLFTEAPFLSRIDLAAQAGFQGVEFHYPYAHDPYAVKDALDASGVEAVLINIRAGDPAAGEWGMAGIPGREDTFRMCLDEAIAYAGIIGVRQLNCLAGVRPGGVDGMQCMRVLNANLALACSVAGEHGIAINLESLNTVDVPGFLVARSDYARHVIERVGAANLRLQFDWYHAAMMREDVAAQMRDLLPLIGHMQFADLPGRHEPGTGELPFASLVRLADELGYGGWISAEYRPAGKTVASLAWMSPPA